MPMKSASACRADDVRVRSCFLVKLRKAKGRKEAGGRLIGSTVGVVATGVCFVRIGWTGVPKAAKEEGRGSFVVGAGT